MTTAKAVDLIGTTTATLVKKRNKRKLPIRNIIDAELVTIDNKKNNSGSLANARELDNLLIPTARDRTILSDLWNNTITTGRPSNSDKPRVVLGTPTIKKVRLPEPNTSETVTAAETPVTASKLEKKAAISLKKDIYKERLSHTTSDSVLDLSGHTIIPLKLAQDMSNKVAKDKALKAQQQQDQQEADGYHSNNIGPTYDYDDYEDQGQKDLAQHETNSNINNGTNTKQNPNVDLEEDNSKYTAVVEGVKEDKTSNDEAEPIVESQEDSRMEKNECIISIEKEAEKVNNSNCATSQIETVAQAGKAEITGNETEKKNTVGIFIKIPTKEEEIVSNTQNDNPSKQAEQEEEEGEEEEEEEEDPWLSNDESEDNEQNDVYQKIYELMFPKSAITLTAVEEKRKAEELKEEFRSKRSKLQKASHWFSTAADTAVANNFSRQEKKKIQSRDNRLRNKLEQPYIIKKKIKSVWFVAEKDE